MKDPYDFLHAHSSAALVKAAVQVIRVHELSKNAADQNVPAQSPGASTDNTGLILTDL